MTTTTLYPIENSLPFQVASAPPDELDDAQHTSEWEILRDANRRLALIEEEILESDPPRQMRAYFQELQRLDERIKSLNLPPAVDNFSFNYLMKIFCRRARIASQKRRGQGR